MQAEMAAHAIRPDTAARNLADAARVLLTPRGSTPQLRAANRTDALTAVLSNRGLGSKTLADVTHKDLTTVITATDLRTSNAMRFGSLRSSCSAYGTIVDPVRVAEAVAASGAFPFLLPAVERSYNFRSHPDDPSEQHALLLTDGGVYDNLGLSVLEPGRSVAHTAHTYNVDYVIACDAGRGKLPLAAGHFAVSRVKRSFDVVHKRSQDAARGRLHEAAYAGRIQGFIHAYLGMPDARLPVPVADLVPSEDVRNYPTNFRKMPDASIDSISMRGEQLTRTLIAHYCPDL